VRVVQVFHHWCARQKIGLYLAEQTAIVALFIAGATAASFTHMSIRASSFVALAMSCSVLFQSSFYFSDLYDLETAAADRRLGLKLLRTLGVAVLLCAGLALLWPVPFPVGALLAGVAGATAAVVATRAALPGLLGRPERVLIVGDGAWAHSLAASIEREAASSFQVAGLIAPAHASEKIDQVAAKLGAQIAVVATDDESLAEEALLRCRLQGVRVLQAAVFSERVLRRLPVTHLKMSDLVYAEGFRAGRVDEFVKRAIDLTASLLLALLASPIMLLAALAVRLDSPGPVFYRQERTGRGGTLFTIAKFRTMRVDAEREGQPLWARIADARVTRVGRLLRLTRMDELPQLWSVVRGDMSFVGPRPERPFFVEQIARQVPFYRLREAIKPGITGWAQIRYPYGASVEDARAKLEYDLYYLKNRSVFLDLAIIFHTVRHVLGARGAR
jgi:exopolysaccharide biosynthesis polyprenyl glycosylphosphotransferase